MSTIRFEAALYNIGSWTLLRLPKSASAQLPSRGVTMVEGTINGFPLQSALEPDGKGSHWLRVDKTISEGAGAEVGDTVMLAIEPTREWTEPHVPEDLKSALAADPQAQTLWMDCTTMARWDWTRWISATAQQETRRRRIEVAFSKLKSGMRRPCCFNRSMCTEPYVSKNGVLLEPTETTSAKARMNEAIGRNTA
ncbi:MAG: YdeI/OmpD-associated family protein [Chloroflexota bacterium]|nr:YdeI/OmpD-associated family protein [Chloroflexota bacterium]